MPLHILNLVLVDSVRLYQKSHSSLPSLRPCMYSTYYKIKCSFSWAAKVVTSWEVSLVTSATIWYSSHLPIQFGRCCSKTCYLAEMVDDNDKAKSIKATCLLIRVKFSSFLHSLFLILVIGVNMVGIISAYFENFANEHIIYRWSINVVGPNPQEMITFKLFIRCSGPWVHCLVHWRFWQQTSQSRYLDPFLTELEENFNETNVNIMRVIQKCLTVSAHFL